MNKVADSFLNNYENGFMTYFEKQRQKNIINRDDYINLSNNISKLKEDFPKVKSFLENAEITDMTDEEKIAILKVIDKKEDIKRLEYMEAFKLGFKEAYLFFKEQGMLNI